MPDKLSQPEKKVLESVRNNNCCLKREVVDDTALPWATASTAISGLINKGWIEYEENENGRGIVKINDQKAYFVGISAGSSNIKISIRAITNESLILNKKNKNVILNITESFRRLEYILDCDYKGQYKDDAMWCFVTPNNYVKYSELLSEICKTILVSCCDIMPIAAICFVFPGHIDINSQTIVEVNYTDLIIKSTNIESLLDNEVIEIINTKNISLYVDHNVKACASYELLCISNKSKYSYCSNMAVLYLGLGIGMGIVLNGQIYRGGLTNLSGQFGKNNVIRVSDEFINDYFNNDIKEFSEYNGSELKTLEYILREDVFFKALGDTDEETKFITYKSTKLEKLKSRILEDSLYKKKIAYYLGNEICNIVKMLSINTFVLSGKLAELYPTFKMELQYVIMKSDCKINIEFIISENGEYSASLGAAEMAYRNTFQLFES